ncbi:hypothetical protein SE17_07065 [Kouleothrix aurantiaca]|uniref:Uncharacterized protein n=1 Tax=Kouleothrix aurantiaca TaxID=186479 RepID=A0A0P9FKY2_9CHLR|nr:hypothetical protein SE17_07065 [Kouleothrix aurantiaca]
MPPDAMLRKAQALWLDDPTPISPATMKRGQGYYVAEDERLQAIIHVLGAEELRQAVHRCRPILSDQQTTLLIFSPWNLAELGLLPNRVISQVPYNNSREAKIGYVKYQQLRKEASNTISSC